MDDEAGGQRPGVQVSLNVLIEGFRQAYARFTDVRNGRDESKIFFALFETLNWINAICKRLPKTHTNQEESQNITKMLEGFRYVRNRVHHQWADAVYLRSGVSFPIQFPSAFHEWMWKKTVDLPQPDSNRLDHKGKSSYEEALADQPVRLTLNTLSDAFNEVVK